MTPEQLRIFKELIVALEDHIKTEAERNDIPITEVCPCTETTIAKANKVLEELGVSPAWRRKECFVL